MRKLDFLVIGVQKCATTWLHACLEEHPDLFVPARKRDAEYLGGDIYEERGADWYFSLLKGAKERQKVGDVAVDYFYDKRSPAVIKQFAPDLKLVVSLRQPVERAISAFYWHLRKGNVSQMELQTGLERGLKGLATYGTAQAEDYFLSNTLVRGFYDEQLSRYLEHFKPEQIMVVFYEDIAADAVGSLRRIYSFLGADPNFVPSSLDSQPKQNTYLKPLIALQRLAPKSLIMGKVLDVTNQSLSKLGFGKEKPQLSQTLQADLEAVFRSHNEQLGQLLQNIPKTQRTFYSQPRWLEAR